MVPEEDTGRMREDQWMGQGLADALQRSDMFLMHIEKSIEKLTYVE